MQKINGELYLLNNGVLQLQVSDGKNIYIHVYDELDDDLRQDWALLQAGETPWDWDGNDYDEESLSWIEYDYEDVRNGGYKAIDLPDNIPDDWPQYVGQGRNVY